MRRSDNLSTTNYKLLPIFWFQERVSSKYLVHIASPVGMQTTNIPNDPKLCVVRLVMLISEPVRRGRITLEIWKNELYTGYATAVKEGNPLTVVWDIPFGMVHVKDGDKIGVAIASSPDMQPVIRMELTMYATTGIG